MTKDRDSVKSLIPDKLTATAVAQHIELPQSSRAARDAEIAEIKQVAAQVLKGSSTQFTGSYRTGTAVLTRLQNDTLKGSDIDVVISSSPGNNTTLDKASQKLCLERIKQNLPEMSLGRTRQGFDVREIGRQKLPILNYKVAYKRGLEVGSFEVDISIDNVHAIKTTNFLVKELGNYPQIKTPLLIIKAFVIYEEIDGTPGGYLSGYALALTFIGFIKIAMQRRPQPSFADPKALLAAYLQFWVDWDYDNRVLNPLTGQILARGNRAGAKWEKGRLCIIDPCDPNDNASSGSEEIQAVRSGFKRLKDELSK